jgi:hypothetical protein
MHFRFGSPRARDGALNARAVMRALQLLCQLSASWHEVDPSDEIRETAVRFLRVHPLRALMRYNWPQHSRPQSGGRRRWK